MDQIDVIVDRTKWYRGRGFSSSKLLIQNGEHTGKMCCLGFASLACGLTEDQIQDKSAPGAACNTVLWAGGKIPNRMLRFISTSSYDYGKKDGLYLNFQVTKYMMNINDCMRTKDYVRESQLTELAATIGLNLTFIN
jgi:hypothetical protein